jgi:protein TIF31
VSTSLADFHPRASENVTPAACVKSIGVSPWNPPPAQYRSKGHLLYLTLTTLEGESVQLTCTVRGWHVNKSTTVSFDPSPRPSPKDHSCHSLIDLLHGLSPAFTEAFVKLVVGDPNNPSPAAVRDVLAISPMQQAIAASPWLANALPAIASDSLRQQSAFLHTGAVGSDGLAGARDWNDEIQQSREMPRESMQDRVVREKNLARTQAEFTATCVKGALAVAVSHLSLRSRSGTLRVSELTMPPRLVPSFLQRGDVQPLNPHEPSASHMWLHNNIFYTKGVDSIDSFSHLGSDEAAHVACGKDAAGIKALNQQDVEGACLLGHTVVDWAGERWVCQSFLPGIFQRREPAVEEGEEKDAEPKTNGHPDSTTAAADKPKPASDNNLIVYGSDAEAGPNVVRWTAPFHSLMKKVADGFRLAEHEVKAGENGETVKVWSSVEVKGLVGTDGRKYILDAFRLAPVDVEFLEKDMDGRAYAGENVAHRTGGPAKEGDDKSAEGKEVGRYPHRLVLLRPELINLFWESEFRKWAHEIASKRQKETVASSSSSTETATSSPEPAKEEEDGDKDPKPEGEGEEKKPEDKEEAEKPEEEQERIVVQVNGDIHVQKPNGEISITPASDDSQSFSLRFNPDAFVEQKPHVPEGKSISDFSVYEPSQITDESDPTVKAVRDASVFLREAAVPAFLADVLTGRESVQDGSVLTKTMHKKGINMR